MTSKGIITSRKCPLCGHHEMGYTTEDGVFCPLKPGTMIQIPDGSEVAFPTTEDGVYGKGATQEELVDQTQHKVWIPEPVKSDKRLRLKYGVLVKEPSFTREMSGEVYRFAYLEKLERLIEKEIHTPAAVIMDRFFTAPHLAAGNPRQIAEAMWRELAEIRMPAQLVTEWLEKQDEGRLTKMIYPVAQEELSNQPVSEAEQHKEFEDLSLEEFLELL
jgi:hypothetical protein